MTDLFLVGSCGSVTIARTVLTGELNAHSDTTCRSTTLDLHLPFQKFAENVRQMRVLVELYWQCSSSPLPLLPYIKFDHLSSVEENISIVVACVPTLGPFFATLSNKTKSLNSRRHGNQREEKARYSRKEKPISLRSIADPARPAVIHESSAEPLGKPIRGRYGSQTGLVPGI